MTKRRRCANRRTSKPVIVVQTRCGMTIEGHPAEMRSRRRDHEAKCGKCKIELAASTNREEE